MLDPHNENSAFSPTIPGLQIAWDSTSLGAFKECPRKYEYTIIRGMRSRAESVHLTFGLHYHAALEWFDHQRSQGADFQSALYSTVAEIFRRCRDWNSDDKYKNRVTLLRTVVWYLDQFQNDPVETIQLANGKPAVELSFRFAIDHHASDGTPFMLSGHMDRLVNFGERVYVLDRKTTKSALSNDFFLRWSPDNQFSLYAFAAKIIYQTPAEGLIVDAAQVAVGFSRFQRGIVPRNDAQLADWYFDTTQWLSLAEHYADQQHWPQNDKSCNNYGGCPFRQVCAKAPSSRETWLNADYHKVVWDPLKVRGDI